MVRGKSSAIVTLVAAGFLFTAAAHADTRRAGKSDLLLGLGAITSQEATIVGSLTLDAGDGSTFNFQYRYHFNENVGLEVDLIGESERTHLKLGGFTLDSVDSETDFFLVNALFNLSETPISPFVAVGVGRYDHQANAALIQEGGPVFDAAVGLDGRTGGHLIWAFEARYLNYEFADFQDDWNRLVFSGQMGFHF